MSHHELDPFEGIIQASYGDSATQNKQVVEPLNPEEGRVIYSPGQSISERAIKSYSSYDQSRYFKDFGNFLLHSCTELSDEFELNPDWVPKKYSAKTDSKIDE